ncbi:ABC transporter ATP-binding protein [Tropicimonas isoalkanivorans]|uniref:NitT/TauT family transport system ATP-binding protein n=1 Tax=Tropicimonas isoalkanivorans TaxID=441112 RepID=A0A1I1KQ75_9RHOB|nr:ABC transporter ATP-binding protein [Tropicimonas isoalkanivorans]SFC62939.1 NitT/TauT family transport system ATP-binding protein [Tropicimonas isoalkanivorans]
MTAMTNPQTDTATPATPDVLISSRHLTKIYPTRDGRGVRALDDVSFDVRDGEFISIVGRSGCGKSTLLKILSGLLDHTRGDITLNGRPIDGPDPDIGVVFQSPTLLPWLTITQNVLFPNKIRRNITPAVRERAQSLLATVGLDGFGDRYPKELSGGMQQRAGIVRALVQDPELLLMDEPFGALDAMTREQMNLEVLRIWEESRKTIIFVTHSIVESVFLSDRVFVMTPRPGRLAEVVDIDLPRPRTLDMINSDAFGSYSGWIRKLLEAEGDF